MARLLRDDGWVVLHVKTGRGRDEENPEEPPDLVALRIDSSGALMGLESRTFVWWIEVKSTARPYEQFRGDRRKRCLELADRAGAHRVTLVHWPKGQREPRLIESSDWPV